jgi:hypothetical protein
MARTVIKAVPKEKAKKAVNKTATGIAAKDSRQIGYVAKLDSKKRITVRSPLSEYYAVTELAGGVIVLKPQEAFKLEDLPEEVIAMIDEAAANFKAGKASAPIDLD